MDDYGDQVRIRLDKLTRLRELGVEANLAGVPEEWTQRRSKVPPLAR